MEGLQARLTARLGPLPVWAWALVVLVLILGFMWWKKIGFFAPAGQPSATGSDQAGSSADLPAGLGGLAGAGIGSVQNPVAATSLNNPLAVAQGNGSVPNAGFGADYSSLAPTILGPSPLGGDSPSMDLSSIPAPTGFSPTPVQTTVANSFSNIPIIGSILNRAVGTAPFETPTFSGVPGKTTAGSTHF